MSGIKKINSALISVFYKDGLDKLVKKLNEMEVTIYSTGGTQKYIEDLGIPVMAVEDLTSYPSILGGRVKTLHPKVFGGILARRNNENDLAEIAEYEIPLLDLVVVDLYPFAETVHSTSSENEIIEKIDIGGVSLIRAAAKNFKDTLIICDKSDYAPLASVLDENDGCTSLEQRKMHAAKAFHVTSSYDSLIFDYFDKEKNVLNLNIAGKNALRYGENPHQEGVFYGQLNQLFEQLNGKELSYNNLLDIDAAVHLISDFPADKHAFAILKHNNACGVAVRNSVYDAYLNALACDPVSAFGGVLITNHPIDEKTATEIDKLFCEVLIAPDFTGDSLQLLKSKKNRIILKQNPVKLPDYQIRSALNGVLWQKKDLIADKKSDFKTVTKKSPTETELADMEFANIIVKHTKSNTIVLAKDNTLIASGTGQTSRVDALKQAIVKAKTFGFDLKGAAMASDAFFPFADCVEIARNEGIMAVIQPGGSIKDKDSVDFCNQNEMTMVFTGNRHFKH
jgi:phosphoribosylaminoimidazolecarboxamide formyltransferase/IMP cyclohydrolase